MLLAACSKEEIKAPAKSVESSEVVAQEAELRKEGEPVWRWLIQGWQNIDGYIIYVLPICEGNGFDCLDGFEVVADKNDKAYNNFLEAIPELQSSMDYFASEKWKKLFLGLSEEQVEELATGQLKVVQQEAAKEDYAMFMVVDAGHEGTEVAPHEVEFALTLKVK